jgi:hypothetical protein
MFRSYLYIIDLSVRLALPNGFEQCARNNVFPIDGAAAVA